MKLYQMPNAIASHVGKMLAFRMYGLPNANKK